MEHEVQDCVFEAGDWGLGFEKFGFRGARWWQRWDVLLSLPSVCDRVGCPPGLDQPLLLLLVLPEFYGFTVAK